MPATAVEWWERLVRLLIAVVVSLATGGLVLGFFGLYRPVVVIPVVAALTAAIVWLWQSTTPHVVDPDDNGWALVAGVVGIVACVAIHARYSGQFLFLSRDPAFYNLVGLDLARTGDLTLDGVSPGLAAVPGVELRSLGIARGPGDAEMYVQGFHGLGAVTAPAEWIGGLGLYLRATALLGGVCLLALRRVAVRLTSPWVATFVTGALGASLPFAEFTRNPYSEILVLACVLGALLVLVEGPATPRRLFVASLVAGTVVTARIDSLLVLSGFVAAMVLLPLVIERRPVNGAELAAIVGGAAVPAAVGLVVGYQRSPVYVGDLGDSMRTQTLVVTAVAVGIAAVHLLRPALRRTGAGTAWLSSPRLAAAASVAVALAALGYWFLAPRLLEFRGHPTELVATLQAAEGVDVAPARSYAEQALPRLGMHFGTVLVGLAIAGTAIAVHRLIAARQRAAWLLVAIGAPSLPYLIDNRIVPDMPWAMRRFLPVIIPVMLLSAALTLEWFRRATARLPAALALVAVIALAGPAMVLRPVVRVSGETGSRPFLEAMCEATPEDADVVYVTQDWLSLVALQPIDTFCGVDTVRAADDFDDATVAAAVAGEGAIVFLTDAGEPVPDGFVERSRTSLTGSIEFVGQTVEEAPRRRGVNVRHADVVLADPAGQDAGGDLSATSSGT